MTNTATLSEMYIQWLSGLSVRRVANLNGLSRMTLYTRLVRAYGKDCCNLRRQSLARTMYKEYQDLSLALSVRDTEGLYWTEKTERSYSKHQTSDLSKIQLAAPRPLKLTKPFNIALYRMVAKLTARLVYLTMMSRMNRMV